MAQKSKSDKENTKSKKKTEAVVEASKTAVKKTGAKKATKKTATKKATTKSKTKEIVDNIISLKGKRGLLISFEGSEGSGKTTQIAELSERLENEGFEVVVTREPGGTEIGEEIRHLLMHATASEKLTPEAELLLFAASRAQLVRELILPSLEAGKIILCDRFLDSTTVYQGVGRQISMEPVHIINTFAVGSIMPDLTVVLDVPAELGMARIKRRKTDLPDRMETETIDFYRKVREGYLMLAKAMPERFIVVDGTGDKDKVQRAIWDEVKHRFI